jgi:hypothetical protein
MAEWIRGEGKGTFFFEVANEPHPCDHNPVAHPLSFLSFALCQIRASSLYLLSLSPLSISSLYLLSLFSSLFLLSLSPLAVLVVHWLKCATQPVGLPPRKRFVAT